MIRKTGFRVTLETDDILRDELLSMFSSTIIFTNKVVG